MWKRGRRADLFADREKSGWIACTEGQPGSGRHVASGPGVPVRKPSRICRDAPPAKEQQGDTHSVEAHFHGTTFEFQDSMCRWRHTVERRGHGYTVLREVCQDCLKK